jgi:cytochrome d ubiquinol oxidase subunit I
MGMSLAFHIIFAAIGIALPLMMVAAEWRWRVTKDDAYLLLAQRWAKGTTILAAVGAVSGTVLSFELGLLWPEFMRSAGAIIGMPFSLEGFAFFTEAIFLGIYLYGWNKIPSWFHFLSGVIVALSGLLSAMFVTLVNGWMNTPTGFVLTDGKFTNIRPFAAMLNPAGIPEAVHMILAAYTAAGFATAGIHGRLFLRRGRNRFDEVAIGIALALGGTAVLLQSLSGDALARMVAVTQPAKLASLEGQFTTEAGAPLRIGGLPYPKGRVTKFALEIPHGLSLLAIHDEHALVKGLDQVRESDWPNVRMVNLCFQTMVGCGSVLSLFALVALWFHRKRKLFSPPLVRLLVLVSPLGFVALEAGWMVTELGRQPWIIYHILRTRDAVTSLPHISATFILMTTIYLLLGFIATWLLAKHVIASSETRLIEKEETV